MFHVVTKKSRQQRKVDEIDAVDLSTVAEGEALLADVQSLLREHPGIKGEKGDRGARVSHDAHVADDVLVSEADHVCMQAIEDGRALGPRHKQPF